MAQVLFKAIQKGDLWRVQFLLNRGIPVHVKGEDGENMLVAALRITDPSKRRRMFTWLVAKGVDCIHGSKVTGRDVLIWTAFLRRMRELEVLLEEFGGEIDLRRRDFRGYSALHYATLANNFYVVELICRLMKKYAVSVDIVDGDGLTPYLLAVRLGHTECVCILREVGLASVQKCDEKQQQSPRFWEILGKTERREREQLEKRKTLAMYKTFGRLPQLKAARFDATRVQIVPSKQEKLTISSNRDEMITDGEPLPQNFFETSPIAVRPSIMSLKYLAMSQSCTSFNSLAASSIGCAEDQFNSVGRMSHGDECPEYNCLYGNSRSLRLVPSLMETLTEQCSESFRDAAKRPPSTPNEVSQMRVIAHARTFGNKLKKQFKSKNLSGADEDIAEEQGNENYITSELVVNT